MYTVWLEASLPTQLQCREDDVWCQWPPYISEVSPPVAALSLSVRAVAAPFPYSTDYALHLSL